MAGARGSRKLRISGPVTHTARGRVSTPHHAGAAHIHGIPPRPNAARSCPRDLKVKGGWVFDSPLPEDEVGEDVKAQRERDGGVVLPFREHQEQDVNGMVGRRWEAVPRGLAQVEDSLPDGVVEHSDQERSLLLHELVAYNTIQYKQHGGHFCARLQPVSGVRAARVEAGGGKEGVGGVWGFRGF